MEENKVDILAKVDYYVKLVLKRRWFIIIPFCLSMAAGIYLAIALPEAYSANSLILVVPKSVPDKFVPTLQESDIGQRINSIKQQIMSRSNLERIIDKFNLYSGGKYKDWYLEDRIAAMRRDTRVNVTKSRKGIDSFRIVFTGQNPQTVMQVADSLAASFIDESVRLIYSEVVETNKFLKGELGDLRKELEKIEISIQEYRKQHMGELPEELPTNLRMIENLQAQLSEKQLDLRDAKNRLVELENRIAALKLNEDSVAQLAEKESAAQQLKPKEPSQLEKLQQTLKEMQNRYTDRHPDIIRLKAAIATLETHGNKEASSSEPQTPTSPPVSLPPEPEKEKETPLLTKMKFDLVTQQEAIIKEIETNRDDIRKMEVLIREYQRRVEATPKIEHGLFALKRNYENLQRNYKSLLDRKLESDISVNMEKKQKGQKFRVIDKARLPQKPVFPDMMKLFAACIAGGLGVGGGIIFLMDFLDKSLKVPEEAEVMLGVPVLATIPEIYRSRDRIKHRINHAFSALFVVVGFILFSVLAVMSLKGVTRTVEFVKKFI